MFLLCIGMNGRVVSIYHRMGVPISIMIIFRRGIRVIKCLLKCMIIGLRAIKVIRNRYILRVLLINIFIVCRISLWIVGIKPSMKLCIIKFRICRYWIKLPSWLMGFRFGIVGINIFRILL